MLRVLRGTTDLTAGVGPLGCDILRLAVLLVSVLERDPMMVCLLGRAPKLHVVRVASTVRIRQTRASSIFSSAVVIAIMVNRIRVEALRGLCRNEVVSVVLRERGQAIWWVVQRGGLIVIF